MPSNSKLKIVHWNAQGITNLLSVKQLELFLSQENADVAMLNETFLKSHHKFHLDGFRIYRNDRENAQHGGVAIAVKYQINHKLLPAYETKIIENVSVSVTVDNRSIVLTSAYCPKYHKSFEIDVKKLTPSSKEFLVFGDFNARHSAWNCVRNNTAGNVLYNLNLRSHFFIHHPDSPTHYPHSGATPSTIDILLSSSALYISPLSSHDSQLMSDHAPVSCEVDANVIEKTVHKSPDYKRANWKMYEDYLNLSIDLNDDFDSSVPSKSSIDAAIQKLTDNIIESRNRAVPFNVRKNKSFAVSEGTKLLINSRNSLKREWTRCKKPALKNALKSLLNMTN